jgi:hypothetical protein
MAPAALIPIALQLAQYVPALMRYLGAGSESTAVAEKAVEIAQTVTGARTPEEALAALAASREKQIEFQLAVLEQATELERMYLADRQDARARDVAIQAGGRRNWRADVLAFLAVGGLVVCVWFVARDSGLPERAVNAIMFVAGVLASAVRDVYNFEFGTSRGSEQKQHTLDEILRRKV